MLKYILLICSVLCICSFGTELMAPEITERDIFGFESYNIEEDGAIRDSDGAIKGWFTKNAVYDEYWRCVMLLEIRPVTGHRTP
ncbi:MAG: hypothetical protein ILNGONEN_01255 [Syntrophorhabdaceae bacterium]|nr:hypothetical protein [Syntrophorhabdaceae bacterium]MBV6505691.1 hypothetical protein [Syntrophorhabdaceae bacterium]HNQ62590.1 hypothetical protein [Syntrophorhabdaceae bacterium]HNZ59786.1 hypothetical protein [Syntrophorhabdaceae bacterium]HOG39072.1 hypothetical protein [Syntrophorhabdaceae bacterium]